MSARVSQDDDSLQLTPREITVRNAIRKEPEACKALSFLARKMDMSENELVCHFVQEAFGVAEALDTSWRKRLPDVKEVEHLARTLQRISARVRREVKRLPLWHMTIPEYGLPGIGARLFRLGKDTHAGIVVRDRYYRRLQRTFEHLPEILYLYGANLERKLSWTRGFARTRPTRPQMERQFTDLMVNFVARKCGRPYRDKIVAILRVTHPLANRKAPQTGETLRKRSQRKRARPSS